MLDEDAIRLRCLELTLQTYGALPVPELLANACQMAAFVGTAWLPEEATEAGAEPGDDA